MVNIAFIGVGAISGIYLKNIEECFKDVRIVGLCDLIPERAQQRLETIKQLRGDQSSRPLPKIYSDMYEAFKDPEVQLILNLTRPYEHFEVTRQALLHGKHVYSEKPLGADFEEGLELVRLAKEKGLRLGGAPDTFMGAGIQTCRQLIDQGLIGDPIGAACFMICHGHETWHPDPAFYYQRGGGPMMDMGPYYVTALVQLLGEVEGLTGVSRKAFDQRVITSMPHHGETVDVEVDTYVTGTLHFASGAVGTIFTTFDVYYAGKSQARFEVYGTKGTLIVPDPNTFGGPVLMYRPEDQQAMRVDPGLMAQQRPDPYQGYRELPLMFDYRENSRALGLADMCKALESGRDHRANQELQLHVLEILTGFEKSSRQKAYLPLTTGYERGKAMQQGLIHGQLEA